jgi:hypothetical protein
VVPTIFFIDIKDSSSYTPFRFLRLTLLLASLSFGREIGIGWIYGTNKTDVGTVNDEET